MIILEHSTYDERSIGASLGAPEYSYWFVRRAFRPILRRFGIVVPIADARRDADAVYHSAKEHGTDCVLFSYNPPQSTPTDIDCPVVPVFAWEFDRIPDETWNGRAEEDWRISLARTRLAVTHSNAAAQAIRATKGEDFPVWIIPAPVFDRSTPYRSSAAGWREQTSIPIESGLAIDVGTINIGLFRRDRAQTDGVRALRALRAVTADPTRPKQSLMLRGVIYMAVINPGDGRKNWEDMIAGFIWAFRHCSDATLILKLTLADMTEALLSVLEHIDNLGRFACRIILLHGFLSDKTYEHIVEQTSYALNTSQGEGQCLPLMEFMAAGRPAVAPRHTAMLDYLNVDNGFVVASHLRPGFWPHDERQAHRCLRHEIQFDSLVQRLRESYRVAVKDPDRYARMSQAAIAAQRAYCSDELVMARLSNLFDHLRSVTGQSVDPAATRRQGVMA